MKLIGESAMRSEAHRARGKRNQNKQLVRSANSLISHHNLLEKVDSEIRLESDRDYMLNKIRGAF